MTTTTTLRMAVTSKARGLHVTRVLTDRGFDAQTCNGRAGTYVSVECFDEEIKAARNTVLAIDPAAKPG